ncbi:MAG TPA: Ldh family oxidoreductase [Thermomicrobiales bacterium]|nr:Ldh family oxidoreductase [Thermomicrobiales bacterium]
MTAQQTEHIGTHEDDTARLRVPRERLADWTARAFVALGASNDDARRAVEILVTADERGVESHGLARLPYYAGRIRAGLIDLDAALTVEREGPATLAFAAHNGLGLVLAPQAMERTIAKASEIGLCMTTVGGANHFGIAGAYAAMAARAGLGGMAMTNATPLVVPTFGARAMVGTNPLAFAVPTGPAGTPPLVIDMATSTVAWGKIEIARRAGAAVPLGWALDEAGAPTADPFAAHWLTPLGGDRETCGHKGYSLAVLVDTLCGPLAGAAWGVGIGGIRGDARPANLGHWFLAWRIDAFRDPDAFYADVNALLAELRASPTAPGAPCAVLAPGDPEIAAERDSRAHGVSLAAPVVAELRALADSLDLPWDVE